MASVYEILKEIAEIFAQKSTDNIDLIVQFELLPKKEVWFLKSKPGEQLEITKSIQEEPQIIFSLSHETLSAIYSGEMTGLTAMGRENMSDQTPLNFTLGKGVNMTPDLMASLLEFVQRFFNPTYPDKVNFNKSSARLVHGGRAIPQCFIIPDLEVVGINWIRVRD